MFSRRGILGLLGIAAAAPVVAPVLKASDGVALNSMAHPTTSFGAATEISEGAIVEYDSTTSIIATTRPIPSALWPGVRRWHNENFDASEYQRVFGG